MDPVSQARELINSWLNQAGKAVNNFTSPKTVHSFGKIVMPPVPSSQPLQRGQTVASFPGYQAPQAPPPQFDFQQAGQMIGTAAGAVKGMFSAPPSPQGPKMWGKATNQIIQQSDIPGASPTASAMPIPSEQPMNDDFRFAYEQFPQDTNAPGRKGFKPNQPPSDIGQLIREMFPNEATAAALVAATENAQFDSNREDNINKKDGSRDRGIFQINSNTFNGLMERQGEKLRKQGINSFEDMRDPRKNAIVAKMIKEGAQSYKPKTNPKGWSGWYGWQDTGYDINDGWFAPGIRADYEEKKKGKK